MREEDLLHRIAIVAMRHRTCEHKLEGPYDGGEYVVAPGPGGAFRAAGLRLLDDTVGASDQMYKDFDRLTEHNHRHAFQRAAGIIEALETEVQEGWLIKTAELLAAGLFNDFLAMAEELLAKGYKASAAVVAGITLEAHLHRLAAKADVDVTFVDSKNDLKKKQAGPLNEELGKAEAYTKSYQQQVTAWLKVRNDSAHPEEEPTGSQVSLMIIGIREFIEGHPA